jgi:Domain of unknown function (DUF1929)
MKHSRPLLCRRSFNQLVLLLCLCLVALTVMPDAAETASRKKDYAPAKARRKTAPAPAALQTGRGAVGEWGPVQTLDTVPVHISLLPDGRLLYWGRDKHPSDPDTNKWDTGGFCNTYTWDPSTGAKMTIANTTTNLFCSAHSFLPDGRLLVAGGHVRDDANKAQEGIGEDDVNVFDYRFNTWTRVGFMPRGRWYPSTVTLASGETVIISGFYRNSLGQVVPNETPDLFTSAGTIRPFTAAENIALYPFLGLAPTGKVFVADRGINPSKYFDPAANSGNGLFTDVATTSVPHREGSGVIYDSVNGRVLMMGGQVGFSGALVSEAEVIELGAAAPSWRSVGSLNIARKYHTATLLPDGKVLVSGGTQCTGANDITCIQENQQNAGMARSPELWDPQTETWTTMAPNPSGIPRVYHSVALLLPDARVLVGGGGLPAAGGEVVPAADDPSVSVTCVDSRAPGDRHCRIYGHKDAEIFSPRYLFTAGGALAARPVISSAPASVTHGQSFNVTMNATSQTGSVVLIRLPSVTHTLNFDQRRVVLDFAATSGTNLSVSAPADGRVCPPGHYMLFVLNTAGVPSVAKIVKVEPSVQPPGAPSALDAEAVSAPSVTLTWSASAGNVSHYVVERAPTRTGPFSTVGANVEGTTFTDTTAAGGLTYVYRVRAVGPSGAVSAFSNADIATTISFADHPLLSGVLFKAEHMNQLRQAVNAVRAAAGLAAADWTDPTLSSAVFVKAVHVQELRSNLDPALSLLGLPVSAYTDPTLAPNFTLIRAVHWQEIRDRVK